MKVCFVRDESVSQPGKYIIRPNHDNFHLNFTEGSFNVICARLFGITYAQYLRMCRDCYDAEIIGKQKFLPLNYTSMEAKTEVESATSSLQVKRTASCATWPFKEFGEQFQSHASSMELHNLGFVVPCATAELVLRVFH